MPAKEANIISLLIAVCLVALTLTAHHADASIRMWLHLLNTLLLFTFIALTTAAPFRSGVVAALFAVHPLQIDILAGLPGLRVLAATAVGLVAVLSYLFYVRKTVGWRYGLVVVAAGLCPLVHPQWILLPVGLLLLDYWPLGRFAKRYGSPVHGGSGPYQLTGLKQLLMEKLPLMAAAVGGATIFLTTQPHESVGLSPVCTAGAFSDCIQRIWCLLWPSHLAGSAPQHGTGTLWIWGILGGILLLVAITSWCWRKRKKQAYLLAGWLLYLGVLLPMIVIDPEQASGRQIYLPLSGLLVIVVWRVADLWQRLHASRAVMALVIGVVLALLVLQTQDRVGAWRTQSTAIPQLSRLEVPVERSDPERVLFENRKL